MHRFECLAISCILYVDSRKYQSFFIYILVFIRIIDDDVCDATG